MSIYSVPPSIDVSAALFEIGLYASQTGHTVSYDGDSDSLPTQIEILPDLTTQEEAFLFKIVAKYQAKVDVDSRFDLSQLANKTPSEIYTAMQSKMDSWTSLADARADLREWLPLMAALIAWKVR